MLLLLPHSSRGPNLDKVRGGRETGKERSASKGWRGKETEESEMEGRDSDQLKDSPNVASCGLPPVQGGHRERKWAKVGP